ncbi:transcriptional regulator, AsnC family [Sulfobacillus acidophilus TPY]|uniref:Transcriptional regulator, AsnC family n=1 Tax=Sulfobacillus acidophilus (strain ATCC 700253 / DSM 10332 / NAL) TaxID=679936 RepID=G8TYF6_SULAD|nr:transcriptional regulator, AsnC family [Sulfobacillus acidophilus TPY]AEW06217.1 transcriptional regulator, AsnC family [Sulfobacillus acidophilus DSM 10332]
MELDDIDRQILVLLHDQARMPLQELATRIGLSRAAVHDRVKKLIQSGVIRGFELRLDPDLLGYPVLAWIGLLTVQGTEAYQTLEDLSQIPEIEAAYVVTGHFDFLVKVRARNNAHLQQLLFEKIDQVHGFQRSETMVVLSAAVDKGALDPKLYQSS